MKKWMIAPISWLTQTMEEIGAGNMDHMMVGTHTAYTLIRFRCDSGAGGGLIFGPQES